MKVNLVAIDIFTGKKYTDICPSTHNMQVPIVTKTEMMVVDVVAARDYISLMEDNGSLRSDLRLPEGDLATDIRTKYDGLRDDQMLMVS